MNNRMAIVNITTNDRKSVTQLNAVTSRDQLPVQYLSPLAYCYNVSFFLLVVPFRLKWNANEGSYIVYTNKLQNVNTFTPFSEKVLFYF